MAMKEFFFSLYFNTMFIPIALTQHFKIIIKVIYIP